MVPAWDANNLRAHNSIFCKSFVGYCDVMCFAGLKLNLTSDPVGEKLNFCSVNNFSISEFKGLLMIFVCNYGGF